jgi:arabinogalactan oligomer/maltooligosaccharide transport system permease protein
MAAKNNKKKKNAMGIKKATLISNIIIYVILVLMMIVWLFPFICMVLESLRADADTASITGHVIPEVWGIDSYKRLFQETKFARWYLNTFITAVFTAIFQTFFVLSMSYTLSRLRFKGRKFLMNFMLILGMFPGFLSMILLYKVMSWVQLTQANAVVGLVIVYCASSGMGYYVSKGFFDTIPRSLDEAARVDGANRFQVFYKIILPLSKPIVIYTVLTAFMGPWGDFMFASYMAHAENKGMNVAVGLKDMIDKTRISTFYTAFCAGGVLVAVPVTTLFMFLQRYYVEGVTGGAVKG